MSDSTSRFLAAFNSAHALERAIAALHDAGVTGAATYTPAPLSEAADGSPSGVVGAVAGLAGVSAAFATEAYANIWGYPLDIGGRPKFSWPSFVPIALEVGILVAIIGVFVCVFVTAPLLRLYEPVDDDKLISRASSDRWIIVVPASAPGDIARARDICANMGALDVKEIA